MKKVLGIMVVLAVAFVGSGWAQEARRPKIGLVLGGAPAARPTSASAWP